jgi:hypothetical protein
MVPDRGRKGTPNYGQSRGVAVGGGFADFAGLGLAALGSVPAVVGVGLILAGAVARRSASDRYLA